MRRGGLLAFASLSAIGASLPPYCAKVGTPAEQEAFVLARKVPELSVEARQLGLSLLHVSTIIRHGARTPANRYPCWKDYKPQWNCDLNEVITPALSASAEKNVSLAGMSLTGIEKLYDVSPASNELGGTCGRGHLLLEGYQQHQLLGRIFSDRYQRGSAAGQPLIPPNFAPENIHRSIRFRASDMQRTVLSGSSFMESFIRNSGLNVGGKLMQVHTVDEHADYIFPNYRVCPALQQLKEDLFASDTFAEMEKKYARTRELFTKFADISIWPGDFYDCILSFLCTHGEEALGSMLPGLEQDQRVTLLNDTMRAVDEYAVFQFTAQDRTYSKTANIRFMVEFKSELIRLIVADITHRLGATKPAVAADMLAKIVPLADLQEFYSRILNDRVQDFPFDAKRLVVYAAHDTTILQFLGSLGDSLFFSKWPPYASQVVLEVYKGDADYFFRLIYNGAVVTDRLAECNDDAGARDACPLSAFFAATEWATPSKVDTKCEINLN